MKKDDINPTYFPIAYEVEAGKTYRWCSCGASKTQPFCDRNDCKLGVEYYAPYNDTLYFCGCKQTNDPPFCDGSHAKLLLKLINERNKQ